MSFPELHEEARKLRRVLYSVTNDENFGASVYENPAVMHTESFNNERTVLTLSGIINSFVNVPDTVKVVNFYNVRVNHRVNMGDSVVEINVNDVGFVRRIQSLPRYVKKLHLNNCQVPLFHEINIGDDFITDFKHLDSGESGDTTGVDVYPSEGDIVFNAPTSLNHINITSMNLNDLEISPYDTRELLKLPSATIHAANLSTMSKYKVSCKVIASFDNNDPKTTAEPLVSDSRVSLVGIPVSELSDSMKYLEECGGTVEVVADQTNWTVGPIPKGVYVTVVGESTAVITLGMSQINQINTGSHTVNIVAEVDSDK